MFLKGSDAAERSGGYWSLSYEDHPAAVLLATPKKFPKGRTIIASLSMEEIWWVRT